MRINYYVTKKWLVVLLLIAAVGWVLSVLSGCGHAGLRPPGPEKGVSGPGNTLSALAVWATWIAGLGLLACGIAAVFLPNKLQVAKLALGCFAALLTAGIMHWIAAHWAVLMGLCAVVLVLTGCAWVYINRRFIEKKSGVDLNRDGKIG